MLRSVKGLGFDGFMVADQDTQDYQDKRKSSVLLTSSSFTGVTHKYAWRDACMLSEL